MLQLGPVNQQSEVCFGEGLTPVSASQTVSQAGMEMGSDLQFTDGRVTGSANLPPQMGGEKTFDAEVVQGTLFEGMDQFALAVADLEAGKTITLPVFSVQSGGVVNQTFEVTGMESVTVPAGSFETYRIEFTGGPQAGTLYVRQDAPHVVVRQELADQPVTLELQSIER